MKITLINGSPKPKNSSSGILLNSLKGFLTEKAEISEISLRTCKISDKDIDELKCSDVWIFSFPLYVDGIPSHLLSNLMSLEKINFENVSVYAIVNCGFYEGTQTKHALSLMENWCIKTKLNWMGGTGVGCGGALSAVPLQEKGPFSPIYKNLKALSEAVINTQPIENSYSPLGFPRSFYKITGELTWKIQGKNNGLNSHDLKNKPEISN